MARGILRARGSVSPEPVSPPPPIGQGRKIGLESVSGRCSLQLADAPGESSAPCEPGRVALVWGCGDPGGAWFQNPASTLAVRGGFLSQRRMVCLDRSCPLPSECTSLALEILFFIIPKCTLLLLVSPCCHPGTHRHPTEASAHRLAAWGGQDGSFSLPQAHISHTTAGSPSSESPLGSSGADTGRVWAVQEHQDLSIPQPRLWSSWWGARGAVTVTLGAVPVVW